MLLAFTANSPARVAILDNERITVLVVVAVSLSRVTLRPY